MDEAEQTVRKQMGNRKGAEAFIVSARLATYNRLFGLNPATAYRSPQLVPDESPPESQDGSIDLSVFNKKETQ